MSQSQALQAHSWEQPCLGPKFCFVLIEIWLIYSVVLTSAVHLCDSIIYKYTFVFIFFPIMVYPGRLDIVPCAIQ